jgi:hypothetical protein
MCFGADGVQTVKTQLYGEKFWGSFVSVIQNTSILLLLIGDISEPAKSLQWQYFDEHNSFLVDTSNIPVSAWLSVAVFANNITAMYWDNSELRLGFYCLRWDSYGSDTLILDDKTTSVSLQDEWENLKAWQEYSRAIVSSETNNILVALVEEAYSEEQLPNPQFKSFGRGAHRTRFPRVPVHSTIVRVPGRAHRVPILKHLTGPVSGRHFDGTYKGDVVSGTFVCAEVSCEIERDIPARRTLLSQRHFAEDVLRTFEMWDCIPALTPMKPGTRLTKEQSNPSPDPAFHRRYRGIVGSLGNLVNMTRPDLAWSYSELSKYVQYPGQAHMDAALHVRAEEVLYLGSPVVRTVCLSPPLKLNMLRPEAEYVAASQCGQEAVLVGFPGAKVQLRCTCAPGKPE